MILFGCETAGKAGREDGKILRPKAMDLYRAESGTDGKVILSVSHTGSYWFCLAGEEAKGPIGLDCELSREMPFTAISDRWFPLEEQQYVARTGRRGFLQLWTAKEALAKYSGKPLMSLLSNVCLSDGQRVLEGAFGAQIREIDLTAWDEDLVGSIAFDPRLRKGADIYPKQWRIEDPACL